MAPTWMEFLSAETLETWAEDQGRTLDAVGVLLEAVAEEFNPGDPNRSACWAALYLLAQAHVLPRMLLDEAAFAKKIAAERAAQRGKR